MIKVNNLRFAYKKRQSIFESLDLELSAGRIYGLLGSNGSGKSTLLKLLTGMLTPDSGSVETLGVAPSLRLPSMMEDIYYLPEMVVVPALTMRRYAALVAPLYKEFDHSALARYMEDFGLDLDTRCNRMSMGQMKKSAIAFALACNCRLLIMDEPTNGLDIPSKSVFRRIVANIADSDRTVIVSTHQVRDLENLIDSLIILNDRRVVVNASIDDISNKLECRELSDGESALYEEQNSIRRRGVVESKGEGRIDIELLFNAAVAPDGKVAEILTPKKPQENE